LPPSPPDLRTLKRVAIVKLSAIGDVVHALPVSAALGKAFPHLEVTWIVEQNSAPMVQGNPYLTEVIVLPEDLKTNRLSSRSWRRFMEVRKMLRERQFELAIDLQGLSKSAIVTWATGARYRYGQDWLRELAPLFEKRIPRRPESIHIVDQLLDVARHFGACPDSVEFPLHIPAEEETQAVELMTGAGILPDRPYLVINPSHGGGGHKGWSTEGYAKLVDAVNVDPGIPVLLVGSKSDNELANSIMSRAANPPVSLVGKTSLKQLAAILKRSSLHLCGDTGSAHIAAALGTRVITIFGRTDPDRLAPYGNRQWVVHHRVQCADPCRHYHETMPVNRKQKCLAPPPRCMDAVEAEEVIAMVRRALSESP
jgi:heptosyltransferase-1